MSDWESRMSERAKFRAVVAEAEAILRDPEPKRHGSASMVLFVGDGSARYGCGCVTQPDGTHAPCLEHS